MEIRIKKDHVEIEGYVNAIERNSRPLLSRIGRFIERICKGAFGKAIKRNEDIHILLNHDWRRDLGSTKQGNLELTEDNIGLHARATITDPDVVKKARNGDLIGWSFGFDDREVDISIDNGITMRAVKDLDLYEVSILDRAHRPAYEGTLIHARAEGDKAQYVSAPFLDAKEVIVADCREDTQPKAQEQEQQQHEQKTIDYTKAEQILKEIKKGDM